MSAFRPIADTFAVPVVLVSEHAGRESFQRSDKLFARLESREGGRILAIWHGDFFVSEPGLAALEAMLSRVGFKTFRRASKARPGPERRFGSKFSFRFLGEYLEWEWVNKSALPLSRR